jgi:hypothetical protein
MLRNMLMEKIRCLYIRSQDRNYGKEVTEYEPYTLWHQYLYMYAIFGQRISDTLPSLSLFGCVCTEHDVLIECQQMPPEDKKTQIPVFPRQSRASHRLFPNGVYIEIGAGVSGSSRDAIVVF